MLAVGPFSTQSPTCEQTSATGVLCQSTTEVQCSKQSAQWHPRLQQQVFGIRSRKQQRRIRICPEVARREDAIRVHRTCDPTCTSSNRGANQSGQTAHGTRPKGCACDRGTAESRRRKSVQSSPLISAVLNLVMFDALGYTPRASSNGLVAMAAAGEVHDDFKSRSTTGRRKLHSEGTRGRWSKGGE